MPFPSATTLPLAQFPKSQRYDPVLLLHNDIWYNADNICGDQQQIGSIQRKDHQVGCRIAAIGPTLIPDMTFLKPVME